LFRVSILKLELIIILCCFFSAILRQQEGHPSRTDVASYNKCNEFTFSVRINYE